MAIKSGFTSSNTGSGMNTVGSTGATGPMGPAGPPGAGTVQYVNSSGVQYGGYASGMSHGVDYEVNERREESLKEAEQLLAQGARRLALGKPEEATAASELAHGYIELARMYGE